MTDLDSTEILAGDESVVDDTPILDNNACLKVVSGTDPNTFAINKETTIGRSSPSDVVISAPSLSKQHAKITIKNGQYFLTDLGSSNKTFHNKVQLQANVCYALHDNDEIKLGDIICSFQEQKQTNDTNHSSNETLKQNGVNKESSPIMVPPIIESTDNGSLEPQIDKITPAIESLPSSKSELSAPQENTEAVAADDDDQNTDSPSMVIDDKQSDSTNDAEDEVIPKTDRSNVDIPPTITEPEVASDVDTSLTIDPTAAENEEEEEGPALIAGRGVARRNARRARGRRGGAASRARVVSTRLHAGRRDPVVHPAIDRQENNTTLEETVNTETEEESPKKSKVDTTPKQQPSETNTSSNVRVSARIKDRASSGRNKHFPYTDDYVDLDHLEKQSRATAPVKKTVTSPVKDRQSNRGRSSASPQKRISLRQQPIDAAGPSEQEDTADVYEQMDVVTENKKETPKSVGRKRKSTPSVSEVTTKRSRPTTPQTLPKASTRGIKQTSVVEQSPTVAKPTRRTIGGPQVPTTNISPKRGRKSTKTSEKSPEKVNTVTDRPVRIALSSHLNFDQNYIDALRKLGFEIMDESCQVDALVVDRIRRTKKFFMCLARGAHILSPAWIEIMIKENRYVPYDNYYLEDTNAETRYGFQLRESVRLAKQGPIFANRKFFCTKDTSPPYEDLKDIIEAAGGELLDKINMTKPGKDFLCIVAQIHKNDYEGLFKKGVPVLSEEFILSGISKQKLDLEPFSLFQTTSTVKPLSSK